MALGVTIRGSKHFCIIIFILTEKNKTCDVTFVRAMHQTNVFLRQEKMICRPWTTLQHLQYLIIMVICHTFYLIKRNLQLCVIGILHLTMLQLRLYSDSLWGPTLKCPKSPLLLCSSRNDSHTRVTNVYDYRCFK